MPTVNQKFADIERNVRSFGSLTGGSGAGSLAAVSTAPRAPRPATGAGAGAILQLVRSGQATTRADLAAHHRPGPLDRLPAGRRPPRPRPAGRPGRQPVHRRPPATQLAFNDGAGVVLCGDLGATHSRLAVTDLGGARAGPDPARDRHRRGARGRARLARGGASTRCSTRSAAAPTPSAASASASPGPSSSPPAGRSTRRSCPGWDRVPRRRAARRPLRRARPRRQRREHHGARRALVELARTRRSCCS